MRDVLTTRGQAFVAAGITLALCGLGLGFVDITRVGVLLVALPLVAAFLARRQHAALQVERHLVPPRVSVDEPATVTVSVENAGERRSPLLLVEERLDYVLGDRPRFLLGAMQPGEGRQVDYAIRSHLRGRHRLGPLAVQLRDAFGLTTRFAEVGGYDEVVVLPRVEPLAGGRLAGQGLGQEGETPHMVALHGEDDQSIREYRDGDDLRRIHWPATARTGDLMVRQEDRPARRRAVLLLDPRVAAHRGSGAGSSFEWAVTAVASVLVHLAEAGFAVHLVSSESTRDGAVEVVPDTDAALDLLAEARTGGDGELDLLVHAAHVPASQGGLVVAVLADRDEEAVRQVASLRQPGSTGLAVVLDTATFGDRDAGSASRADPGSPGDDATAYADMLRIAGWHAVTVPAGQRVAGVWQALTARGVAAR
ncbi:DUF58 domain-containing protein [Lapillicoccus jejuensis]|uniref:Uncharacterized protein (DUF58 family) n=1 Tax=Lapillicoccus jejuensis TaxID=402171 RepID=A0A542E6T4_9MICO|nr:DUF58 domain-containing protein [Lapillicoccus jejuensis]TQJ11038.1 uncharacterized protein (DUF58 family) [Lapillicoccus jejuensis]